MLVILPMVREINARFGETVRGLLSENSDPAVRNYSRNSASPEMLDSSYVDLMEVLEADEIALVGDYRSEASGRLINLAVGHGYVKGGQNVNPVGMGLVTSRRKRVLATTWADAPAWVACYVDPENPAVRVVASGSGIWHLLRFDTPGQTVALIRSEVERQGGEFDIRKLWVTTSPGARSKGNWPFRLDEKGRTIVLSGPSAKHPEVIELLDNPTPEPWRVGKPPRPYAMDLAALVAKLWQDQGVVLRDEEHPEGKLFFDDRPNAEVSRANKRAADAAGQTTWSSEVIAISLV